MTHQQLLHETKTARESEITELTKPGASVGFAGGVVGISVRDKAKRLAMATLDVQAIDDLIDELLLARAHLVHDTDDKTEPMHDIP
jgi:hypothetical protein